MERNWIEFPFTLLEKQCSLPATENLSGPSRKAWTNHKMPNANVPFMLFLLSPKGTRQKKLLYKREDDDDSWVECLQNIRLSSIHRQQKWLILSKICRIQFSAPLLFNMLFRCAAHGWFFCLCWNFCHIVSYSSKASLIHNRPIGLFSRVMFLGFRHSG